MEDTEPSSSGIQRYTAPASRKIIFSVSGEIFETWQATLQRFPNTLLGDENKLMYFYCYETGLYFFDRNRIAFESILFFYQSSGRLVYPQQISLEVFETECEYFQIPSEAIQKMKQREGFDFDSVDKSWVEPLLSTENHLRTNVWYTLEYPKLSRIALVYGVFSLTMIVLSTLFMCLQTIPALSKYDLWYTADGVFGVWFSLEYILRFWATPNRVKFLFSTMNIIDFLASIPYLVLFVYKKTRVLSLVRLLRLIRLVRLLQLTSSSKWINRMKSVMSSSVQDLGLLLLCLMLVVIFGGSLLYVAETDTKNTGFTTIPQSCWWAVQTVVVLGYGDIVPITLQGKMLASFFMVFGALTISLPVLSVVTKLIKLYERR